MTSTLTSVAWFASLTLLACGNAPCLTHESTGVGWTDDSGAVLRVTESRAAANRRSDAGIDGPRLTIPAATDVRASLPDHDAPRACGGTVTGTTGDVFHRQSLTLNVHFDCPSGPGVWTAEALHAEVCDESCSPISGTLTVRTFVPRCPLRGGCGRINAKLDLTTDASAPGPVANGTIDLSYSEQVHEDCAPIGPSAGG